MACTDVDEKKQNGMDGGENPEKATPLSCEGEEKERAEPQAGNDMETTGSETSCKPDIEKVDLSKTSNRSQRKSLSYSGFDVYKADIDSLKPRQLITDTILSVMISEHCCEFPVVDTLFFSILVGEQELTEQKSSRLERIKAAQKYFKVELFDKDYIFVPINRSLHWLLLIISPWHILILDSLTWDIEIKRSEFEYISRFINYLYECSDNGTRKLRSNHVLKVPQQGSNSNNCAVYVSLFIKHFLKDIEEYEECPGDFISKEHKWLNDEDATMKRQRWHRTLGILFDLHSTRELQIE